MIVAERKIQAIIEAYEPHTRRIRVGDYRISTTEHGTVLVVQIGHRPDVYR